MEDKAVHKTKKLERADIDLRSDDIRDILGKPPGWLVRYGIGTLFLIVVVVITGSSLFNYPDIVRAPVVITRENPPSVIIARSAGKPEDIFFKDGATVYKSDTIAVIENPARYIHVFRLGRFVSLFNRTILSGGDIVSLILPEELVLGDVQPAYNTFVSTLNDLRLFINQDYYESRITALSAELDEFINYRENLRRQQLLAKREMELGSAQFTRDSTLFASGVISDSEYERSQALLLTRQKELENAGLILSDAVITIARLERSIADTRLEKEEKHQRLMTGTVNAFRQLESSLAEWENRYLLVSPASGILNYLSVWSSLQELKAGDAVFSVTPEDMGELYARIILPFRRAGKVSPGQRVNIKLEGYPYMEFGLVEGRVLSVSGGPVENGFPAVISLTKGAETTFGYKLDAVRELPGTAEISTDEMSLLERLVSPLRHLAKSRFAYGSNN
jgi:multidrug efflux pump subunit AcrA (membrane-fusion protein)